MSASPADIERESEQHRANIAALVDELRDRVSPGEIANQLLGPDAGAELMRAVGYQARKQIRNNPLPVALIGAGVAWILLANGMRRQRQIPLHDGLDYEDYEQLQPRSSGILGTAARVMRSLEGSAKARLSASDVEELTMVTMHSGTNDDSPDAPRSNSGDDDSGNERRSGFIGRTMQKGRDAATGAAQTALQKSGEALSRAAEATGQAASSLMERTTEMARRTGRAASNTASRTGSGIGQLAREQPLLVAGVGFAIGVALGALIPLSRMENDMLGEQAEKLKDSAKELASEGYERVKSVAQRTYDAASEKLRGDEDSTASQTGTSTGESTSTSYGSENGGDSTAAYRH
ncbi:MAG TPA: DUF3618 domain-containing protein [Rhizomicrobium sp.]|nr:DUF3618 domain-containing protein [Rhizomicrobium sp.]